MSEPTPAPLVSVVMSVYNGEAYVREALASLLAQTFTDFEVVCIDDGSADGTAAILAEIAAGDGRVRVLTQENQGLIASLNRGCREARGRLIGRMDDDDVCHPERLERQVAFLDVHPEVGILGTVTAYIDADGEPTGGRWPRWAPPGVNGWHLLFKTVLCHPTVLMRREVLAQLDTGDGPYLGGALHAEDYELWTRALFTTRVANLPEALLTRRKWEGAIGAQHAARQEQTVIEAMQAAHARLLGRTVPSDTVALVRDRTVAGLETPADTPEALEAAARHVLELYDAYTDRFPLDATAAEAVRRDAADRMVALAKRARPQSAAAYLSIMNLLLRVEPRWVWRELRTRLKRKMTSA